jgi:hypothetical protein
MAALLGFGLGWLGAGAGDKSQLVRMLDVTVVGPGLVLVAAAARAPLHTGTRALLAGLGGATMGYNLRNFLVTAKES